MEGFVTSKDNELTASATLSQPTSLLLPNSGNHPESTHSLVSLPRSNDPSEKKREGGTSPDGDVGEHQEETPSGNNAVLIVMIVLAAVLIVLYSVLIHREERFAHLEQMKQESKKQEENLKNQKVVVLEAPVA
jgi:hypothetical protein